ncbi:MAG: uroporphyrinogen decarboxylase family protein [Candidatus Neomarinimicrobiota bacterium]|tara:strand:+ start:115 stop:1146 length:1032 start_codon:yes stop_codon:yes gene_type:complete
MRNKRFENALKNIPQQIPPIWFMRQAGRYHSHYQGLRKKYSFEQLCKNHELASQVACGPIDEFDYDVAILFSDILFPLESMGLKLKYAPGPIFDSYFNENSITKIKPIDEIIDDLSFQRKALIETRSRLPDDKSLVGFVGGPWTLLSYGLGIKNDLEKLNINNTQFFEKLLYDVIIPVTVKTIEMQLESEAEIVYIFDTNARQLKTDYFLKKYIKKLKDQIFNIYPKKIAYFSKDNPLLNDVSAIQNNNLAGLVYGKSEGLEMYLKRNQKGFLQGNFEPSLLEKPFNEFKKGFDKFMDRFSKLSIEERSGWICSLNHGVLPKSSEYNVKYFIDSARESFSVSK